MRFTGRPSSASSRLPERPKMGQIQAIDVFAAARDEGQNDPYILLSRLVAIGIEDSEARELLRKEHFDIGELVDARLAVVSGVDHTGGFVRRY
jgi:hypothetical protein